MCRPVVAGVVSLSLMCARRALEYGRCLVGREGGSGGKACGVTARGSVSMSSSALVGTPWAMGLGVGVGLVSVTGCP